MQSPLTMPSLHRTAGRLSATYQSRFLWLIRAEYIFLISAGVLALDFSREPNYFIGYALLLVLGLAALLVRSLSRPEQGWYKARAVAESIKTSAWRYAMRAHPYDGSDDEARKSFLKYVREIVAVNEVVAGAGIDQAVTFDQVTAQMISIRHTALSERLSTYLTHRVEEQRHWYVKKARVNRRAFKVWLTISCLGYAASIGLALSRIAHPEWEHVPIEPLLLFSSSVIGWVQTKRHSELASSYTLTAREIGIALEEADISSESVLSTFVNVTEIAFSREHTQWVARQETAG